MLELEFCSRADPYYKEVRDRHYIPNKGSQGQQLHFVVWNSGHRVGIISGGSSVYSVKSRDDFFGIPKDKKQREELWLPAIVNNTVFRLEKSEPNLGTQILSRWRKVTASLWRDLYGVHVLGFETFIVETSTRVGSMYKAQSWQLVGETAGRTKQHTSAKGMNDVRAHVDTHPKLVYCCWASRKRLPTVPYKSSWRRETAAEKTANKELTHKRKILLGRRF
jgi:hypothetical protein